MSATQPAPSREPLAGLARKSLALVALVSAIVGVAPQAPAAVIYSYATDVANLNLSPGQTGQVNLYLVETTTGASTSRLTAEGGLYSGYVRVAYVPPVTPLASPAFISSLAGLPATFDDAITVTPTPAPSAELNETVDFFAHATGPTGDDLGSGVRRLLLGAVTVQAGTSGGTTTFEVADDKNPATQFIRTFDDNAPAIDAPSVTLGPVSFTVTVPIPEPTYLSVLALCLLPLVGRRTARVQSARIMNATNSRFARNHT